MQSEKLEGLRRVGVRLLLVLLAFVLAARIFSPAVFDPLVPSHADIWRYFAIAQEPFSLKQLFEPRPLMLMLLRMLSVMPNFGAFMFGLLLPALLLPMFLLHTVERISGRRAAAGPAFLYFLVCFSLVTFYQLQTLDFGGCVSGILGCMAVLSLDRAIKRADDDLVGYGFALLLGWLSIEAKPTYSLVLAAAPLLFVERAGWRRTLLSCAAMAGVVALVLVKDKLLGSPFLDTSATSNSNYRIAHDPGQVFTTLWFYIAALLPFGAWPLALFAIALDARTHGYKRGALYAAVVLVFTVLAVLPMVAIPNSKWPMYSWFGASILLLPVAFSFAVRSSKVWKTIALAASWWLLSALAFIAIVRSEPTTKYWLLYNQLANSKTLRSIEALSTRIQPGQRVLIAGPLNAYSPFKNDIFIASRFGFSFDWRVSVPTSDVGLIAMSHDTRRLLPLADIKPTDFDVVAYFDRSGVLSNVGPAAELEAMSPAERAAAIFCWSERVVGRDAAVACLNNLQETQAAEQLVVPPTPTVTPTDVSSPG